MSQEAKDINLTKEEIGAIEESGNTETRRLDVNTLLKRHKDKQIKDKKITIALVIVATIIATIVGVNLVL
tara:strand:- start:238 stop:447 length:210 start_codon:yes stop_codon:yes gene_type:complete